MCRICENGAQKANEMSNKKPPKYVSNYPDMVYVLLFGTDIADNDTSIHSQKISDINIFCEILHCFNTGYMQYMYNSNLFWNHVVECSIEVEVVECSITYWDHMVECSVTWCSNFDNTEAKYSAKANIVSSKLFYTSSSNNICAYQIRIGLTNVDLSIQKMDIYICYMQSM